MRADAPVRANVPVHVESPPVSPRAEEAAAAPPPTLAAIDAPVRANLPARVDAPIEPETAVTPAGASGSGAAVVAGVRGERRSRASRRYEKSPEWRSCGKSIGGEEAENTPQALELARLRQSSLAAQKGDGGKFAVVDESMDAGGPTKELTAGARARIAVGWFFELALFFVLGAVAIAFGIDMSDSLAITVIVVWVVSARSTRPARHFRLSP